jgi:hypothetical protein
MLAPRHQFLCANMKTSFPFKLFIIFLILKLTHAINWDWLWVLSPLWIAHLILMLITIWLIGMEYFKDKFTKTTILPW